NLANLRSISVRVPWSDIAGPDYGYGIVGGNSELVADAVVFDLVKDYSTPPDNALFVYPLGLWWDSATGTTLLSMAIGDGVNTSSELIVTISYAV
ncbi:hypothetical protein LRR18_17675, partial [Mangrovimonas sp. AS39]|uniref:hypothetical protein n=1 Tax=Mangrovimonas futianensis TaxID=2895523 RepID=UPI001E4C1904